MSSTRKLTIRLALLAGLLAVLSCSDDTNRPPPREGGVGDGPGGEGGSPGTLKFGKQTLDTERAGKQLAIRISGSKVGITYFREIQENVTVTCKPSGVSPGGPKPRPAQDIMYVEGDGSTWGQPVKVDQTIGNTAGLSLALDASGKVFVGYLGGEINQNECSSGDAVIASSTDGKSFASKRTVLGAGPVGDTVGYWMAVAVDSKGADHAAFGDVRFSYYEVEGSQKASARYDAADIVAKENGGGVYNGLVFGANDLPIVMHYNPIQKGTPLGGLQLAVKRGTAWEVQQIVAGATKERPSLALSPLGNLGVSYYETGQQQMKYIESDKIDYKKPWTEQLVDRDNAHAGEFSSLAYDSKGNPAVSYYKCGPYGSDTCDVAKDGLRFAWRKDGTNWTVYDVDGGDIQACGTHTGLVFLPGDVPLIAYRCVIVNSTTKDFLAALKVAKGVVQ